jgi:hypothetical protein
MKTKQMIAGAFAGAALFVMTAAAQAATFTSGDIQVNAGGGTTEVAIFLVSATNTVDGVGKIGSNAGLPGLPDVTFKSSIASDWSNGAATIKATNNQAVITSLTFSVPTGWFFTDTLFSTLGSESIKIEGFNGGSSIGFYTNDAVPNGNTDWLTVAINGALMDKIVISTFADGDGFEQLKQFNISGLVSCGPGGSGCAPPPALVPLPATLPLFAAGAGLLGLLGWRRKKKMA